MISWIGIDDSLPVLDALYRLRARIEQARAHAEEWAELALLGEPLKLKESLRHQAQRPRRVERLDLYPGVQHLVMRSEEELLGGIRLNLLTPSDPWPLPFQRPEHEERVLVASAWSLTEQMLRPRALAQLLELVTLMGRQKKAGQLLLQLPLAVEMLAQKQGFSPSVTAPATLFYAWWTRTLSPVGMERQPEMGEAGVKRLQVPAGTPLYGWGDAADGAFLLARGKVELCVGGASQSTPFALVEAGGTFGEEALLEPSTRRWAQALALTDVEVWHLERERLQQRRAADVDIRLLLEQGLLGNLHRLALQNLNPGGISKAMLRRAEMHQRREELQEAQALWRLS